MHFINLNNFKLVLATAAFAVSILVLSACEPQPGSPTTSAPPTNTASNTQATPAPIATPAPRVALTLPLLDAMLQDEEFASELKSSLARTDEELDKLRKAARDAVLKLSNDPAEDDTRSTRASTDLATKELQRILGAERSSKLQSLIDKRVAGDPTIANAKPNQVPTDTRIVINAPAYRMDIFENGKLTKSYKVGIGYPEFPLPAGLREAKSIIFNPTWTPPDEPWVKGKVEPGKTVEAGSKLNPLGPIKIPIGLPSLIHGGKSPDRLGTFASHGCVGLTNDLIQDFAMRLSALSGNAMSMEDVKGYEKKKTETEEVKLSQPVPVELRYETIVVEDGVLKIYRDVYERATNTEENLNRVLEVYGMSLDTLQPEMKKQILDGLEQMAVDAKGEEVDPDANSNTAKTNSSSSRVTRNIKGKKMVEFKIPELAGKGYPAAVGVKM